MNYRKICLLLVCIALAGATIGAQAAATVVGRFSQVEGQVDLLKGGKLPATPVKLQDKVESGDLIRTKTRSKAQITFIDNSTVIITPGSRVTIEEYRFDAATKHLRAVLQVSPGQVLIHKGSEAQEPDFVIKTHTAVVRFRGAEFGCRSDLNFSAIMNFAGSSSVINNSPDARGEIHLSDMQSATVGWARTPSSPVEITAEDRKQFMNPPATASAGAVGLGPDTGSTHAIAVTPSLSDKDLAAGQVEGASTGIITANATGQVVRGFSPVIATIPPTLAPGGVAGTGGAYTFPTGRGPQPVSSSQPGGPNTGGTPSFPTGHGPTPGGS